MKILIGDLSYPPCLTLAAKLHEEGILLETFSNVELGDLPFNGSKEEDFSWAIFFLGHDSSLSYFFKKIEDYSIKRVFFISLEDISARKEIEDFYNRNPNGRQFIISTLSDDPSFVLSLLQSDFSIGLEVKEVTNNLWEKETFREKIPGVFRRLLEYATALSLGVILFIPFCIVALLVRLTSKGPVFYWSKRVGKNNKIFMMPKFRTMKIDTPQVATHLLAESNNYLTPVGHFLRVTSLDEIPQLLSIFKGDMGFVGPRPALFNQSDLNYLRVIKGIFILRPGITGWAQVNGRDNISIDKKVDFDYFYLKNRSFALDFKILLKTIYKVLKGSDVKH